MGMPISLAAARPAADDAAADGAWEESIAELREVDLVFSTYKHDSRVPARPRRDSTSRLPARGARGARPGPSGPRSSPMAPSPPSAATENGASSSRPDRGGQGVGRRAGGRVAASARRHRLRLSAGGDMVCRVADPSAPRGRSASRTRTTRSGSSPPCPCATGALRPPAPRTGAPTSSMPAPAAPPRASRRSRSSAASLTWADIDATAAFAQGTHAADWLRGRPGRTGLVVWAGGRTEIVGA